MSIDLKDVRMIKAALLRRWQESAIIFLTCVAVAIAIAVSLPPTFRTFCKVLVQSPQIPETLARSTVTDGAGEQLEVFQQQILTRENLLELAQRYGVYSAAPGGSVTEMVDDMRKRLDFQRIPFDLALGNVTASVISISFDAPTAQMAADVANDIGQRIVDDSTRQRVRQAADTLDFFQKRADDLRSQLTDAETKLLDFKIKNREALPDSVEFRRTQQRDFQARIVQMQREESDLRQRRLELQGGLQTGTSNTTGGSGLSSDEQLLADLRKTYVDLLQVYTADSPNMVDLKRRIAAQEDVLRNRGKQGAGGGAPSIHDLQVQEIDTRLAEISGEKTVIDASLKELTNTLLATPANETILNALERNYQNVQQLYGAMIGRLADATTGAEIEAGSKGVRFTILETATPPQKPVSPKKTLIAVVGLLAGIFLGLGYPVMMESLQTGIKSPSDLTRGLNIAPLAEVPYAAAPGAAPARIRNLALAAVIGIAVLPSLIVGVTHYGGAVRSAVTGLLKSGGTQ